MSDFVIFPKNRFNGIVVIFQAKIFLYYVKCYMQCIYIIYDCVLRIFSFVKTHAYMFEYNKINNNVFRLFMCELIQKYIQDKSHSCGSFFFDIILFFIQCVCVETCKPKQKYVHNENKIENLKMRTSIHIQQRYGPHFSSILIND